ncbi:MAG: prolyl oligopeptidase family serine peptidase, partial [Pseudobdellovibrio sp.]
NEDEDSYYFLTNKNAKNFKLVKTGFADFNQQHAVEVIPHREDTFIDNFIVFKNYIVLASRTNGLTQFEIYDKATKKLSKITYEDSAYSVEFAANDEYDSPGFRYTYQSLRTPPSVYDYLFAEQKSLLRKTKQVPNFNADLYKTERIFVTVRDGQKVPVSLLMKKEHQKNAQSPALLYGYGSYGSNSDPWFSVSDLSLVDRGFVYAIIHVRGGGEMGRSWTDNGRVLNKKNTFTDFIDVTEYLIKEKYVDPKNIFATGASAGGLLMGAISNMRPDLYKGIIAEVPFVDVLTTMLDSSIPLTTAEYDEWGNPNVKEYYDYIKTYSPYDNVTKKNYPNLLITTGVHDSQVQYWEPAKWAARLRKLNQSNSLILLHTDMDSGHGGKSGRFEQLDETAEQYAFILGLL